DILVQAWYQGGISVIDFTDSSNPVEIAFFDRGPIDEEDLVLGGYWSAYWNGGNIFGTEIARGLDVFELLPSDFLTTNEIAAASIKVPGAIANMQQQTRHTWPAEPVVARAYLDQLQRSNVISADRAREVESALESADALLTNGVGNDSTMARLIALASSLQAEGAGLSGDSRTRYAGLATTIEGIANRLR
ncbi:MAG: hypothetical protein WD772_06475, partial [Pseudohongiellaceae bacterium]